MRVWVVTNPLSHFFDKQVRVCLLIVEFYLSPFRLRLWREMEHAIEIQIVSYASSRRLLHEPI